MIERKATDILLDIEKKIDEVLSIQKNQEFVLKTVLARINNSSVSVAPPSFEQKQIPGIKPGIKLNIQSEEPEKFNGLKTNNISVEQQIQYPDGKPIAVAKIEIFKKVGNDTELVKSTRTNPVGKWMANLSAGDYTISLMKQATGQRSLVNVNFDIIVPDKPDGIIKLENYMVK
jgi:hypothetical protein